MDVWSYRVWVKRKRTSFKGLSFFCLSTTMTHSSSGGGSKRLRGREVTGATRYSSITGRWRWRSNPPTQCAAFPSLELLHTLPAAPCRDTPKMSHRSFASRSLPRYISSPAAAVGISRLAAKGVCLRLLRTPVTAVAAADVPQLAGRSTNAARWTAPPDCIKSDAARHCIRPDNRGCSEP